MDLEVASASGNLLVAQRLIEGRIFVELAAVDGANPVIDTIHTHRTGSDPNDGTETTMEMNSGPILHFAPLERLVPQAGIGDGEMSIGDIV